MSDGLLQGIIEGSSVAISAVDQNLRLLVFNRAFVRFHEAYNGVTPHIGDYVPDLITSLADEFKSTAVNLYRRSLSGEEFTVLYRRPHEGRMEFFEFRFSPLYLGGQLVGSAQNMRNVTAEQEVALEKELHLNAMQAQARLLSAVIENIGDGVMICGVDARVQHVNGAYSRITGFSADELIGRRAELFDSETRSVLEAKGEWREERVGHHKDGSTFAERVVMRLVTNSSGQPTHIVSLHSDVTRQRERERKLHELAHHDALTGLPNRLLFSDRLSQALFQADRHGQGFSVLYIDLDNFKPINDRWGHDRGDLVLKEAARRLLGCLRKADTAARIGGDEFAAVLSEDRQGAAVVAAKIITALSAPLTGSRGKPLGQNLGVSIGISVYPDDGTTASELLEHADEAMYSVKHGAKNGFAFFSSPP